MSETSRLSSSYLPQPQCFLDRAVRAGVISRRCHETALNPAKVRAELRRLPHTMRQHIEQDKNADGLLGVRLGVWLFAFGLMLVSLLPTIYLFAHRPAPRPVETASEDEAAAPSSRQQAVIRQTPDADENAAGYDEEPQFSMIKEMVEDRRTWIDDLTR